MHRGRLGSLDSVSALALIISGSGSPDLDQTTHSFRPSSPNATASNFILGTENCRRAKWGYRQERKQLSPRCPRDTTATMFLGS